MYSLPKIRPILVLVALVAPFLFGSCLSAFAPGSRLHDPVITAALTSDHLPGPRADSFYVDAPQVCCSVMISGSSTGGTTVQASWLQRSDRPGQDRIIYSENVTATADGYLGFTLIAPPEGFSPGEYELLLSIGGKRQLSAPFSVISDASAPFPAINSFSAEPADISSGDACRLAWNTTDAARITITPAPGPVAPSGSAQVSPTSDTDYTLWAMNKRGATSSRITVSVIAAPVAGADLTITDFWTSGNVISYRIKNLGSLPSSSCESYVYRDDTLQSTSLVSPLAPGEERTLAFSKYHFSPRFSSLIGSSPNATATAATNVRVCANGDRSCLETSYDNNCLDHNFGPLMNTNLLRFVSAARWQSSATALSWPMFVNVQDGWAQVATAQVGDNLTFPGALVMSPPAAGGWMQGTFGAPVGDPVELRPFTVPHDCKFTASIGITNDVRPGQSVRFIVGTAAGDNVSYFSPVTLNSGDAPVPFVIDLAGMAGQKVFFVLRVESEGTVPPGSAAWLDPVLVQQR